MEEGGREKDRQRRDEDWESSHLPAEKTSSEIRALKRDVLSLLRDPKLLHVRDLIANPVLRALSSDGQLRYGQDGKQTAPKWDPKAPKGSQVKASGLNGKISWKNRPAAFENRIPEYEVDLGPVVPKNVAAKAIGAVHAMRSESMPDSGSAELLAVLVTRILHGLPSKLLTAAAWKDQTVCWGQYRNFSFESVLRACREIISR